MELQKIQNLKNKHYRKNHYVYYSTFLSNQDYKESTTDNHYTQKPKTQKVLLKFLSFLQHKVTQIMKMIITWHAQRMNQFKDLK
jgi:hypothetical protein